MHSNLSLAVVWYGLGNLDVPIYVAIISFFRENVVVIAFSELRPGSNERYENSAFYGPFRFLIFILIFKKHTNLYISVVNTDRPFHEFFL